MKKCKRPQFKKTITFCYCDEKKLSQQFKRALFKLGYIRYELVKRKETKSTKDQYRRYKHHILDGKKSYNSAFFLVIKEIANRKRIYDLEVIQAIVSYALNNPKS